MGHLTLNVQVLLFFVCVTTPVDLRDDWAARMKQQKKRFFPFVQVVTADCVRSRKEGLLYTILHFSLAPIPNVPDKQINPYYF